MLIDEIIKIEISLSNLVSIPKVHRKFAFFGEINGGKVELTRGNYKTELDKITDKKTHNYISTWFASNGNTLSVYPKPASLDLSEVEISEKNILLVGHSTEDQAAMLATLKDSDLIDKNIYRTYYREDSLGGNISSRNRFNFLIEDRTVVDPKDNSETVVANDAYIFEYLAPYSNDNFFKQNSFLTSNLMGVSLDSLDYLKENNLSALVYFPEFKQNRYFNIGDSAGYNFNLGMLRDDLTIKIRENMFNSLSKDNSYSQGNISKLEFEMSKAGLYYKDLGLIIDYTTASKAYVKQESLDIKNGIVKGYELKYKITSEIKEVNVLLQEDI